MGAATSRSVPDIELGGDAQPAATRQPASTLGPRANRTIVRILDATREVFSARGYSGTTVDEITRVAGVSRASFYTYYPSKRDVLVAVGARSVSDGLAAVERLHQLEPSVDALTGWVADYMVLLERHGAFAFAWTQAAREDEEIRLAGMRAHLHMCRAMGEALGAFGGVTVEDPIPLGMCAFSMIERVWDYCHLYGGDVDRSVLERQIARALWGCVRPVPLSRR
jgi:AcrR family transcriptional regulator